MILVTGASGTVGKAVLAEVARSGAKHRAMYRSAQDAAKAPAGSAAAIADFADAASMARALEGVESMYLVCSPIPELVELESNAIAAAERAGVRRIVLNSALGAGDYGKSFPRWHRQVEERLKSSKLAYCILRPNSFLQNVVAYFAPSIRAQGAFYGAYGEARVSYLDVRDIAAVAATALASAAHDGRTYQLNGPEGLTCGEVAARISQQTGVAARYADLSPEALRQAMLGQGMPDWQATALVDLQLYYAGGKGGAVDGVLESLLGRAPVTLNQFLKEFAGEFRSQAARA